jgi:predicted RNA-binding Zn-ribbon protein involved in translation (DUF1610 family)
MSMYNTEHDMDYYYCVVCKTYHRESSVYRCPICGEEGAYVCWDCCQWHKEKEKNDY